MGSMTDTLENGILDHLLQSSLYTVPTGVWSALFTVIPSDASGGTEVTGTGGGTSSYTRVQTTFTTAGLTATGQSVNSGAVNFATITAGATITVVGWGLMDNATGGTMLYWATVTSTALNVGDQATFPVGNITITQD